MSIAAAYEMLRRAIAAGGDTLAQFHTTEAASVIEDELLGLIGGL